MVGTCLGCMQQHLYPICAGALAGCPLPSVNCCCINPFTLAACSQPSLTSFPPRPPSPSTRRAVVPMANGELDATGVLDAVVTQEGTLESFCVSHTLEPASLPPPSLWELRLMSCHCHRTPQSSVFVSTSTLFQCISCALNYALHRLACSLPHRAHLISSPLISVSWQALMEKANPSVRVLPPTPGIPVLPLS